jgi:hypothetical protein
LPALAKYVETARLMLQHYDNKELRNIAGSGS